MLQFFSVFLIVIFMVPPAFGGSWRVDSGVDDCLPVLEKDYYRYAQQNDLLEDYLRSIDEEAWRQMDDSGGLKFISDDLTFGASYDEFSESRRTYLESVGYTRTQQQATDILSFTTADRAYSAYEKCLRAINTGSPIRVWAAKETMDAIYLRVKYVNPPGVASKNLVGEIQGGSVVGSSAGNLWSSEDASKTLWGVMEEKSFVVNRELGTNETIITVSAADGSAEAITIAFRRADALVTMKHQGSRNIRWGSVDTSVVTPNNPNRDCSDGCTRKVGCSNGKWCKSGTGISLSVKPPYSLGKATLGCSGNGSGHVYIHPVVNNGTSATSRIDNWSWAVPCTMTAERFRSIGEVYCGKPRVVPVVDGSSTYFSTREVCGPLAVLEWKTLTGAGGSGVTKFGQAGGHLSLDGEMVKTGDVASYNYGYSH